MTFSSDRDWPNCACGCGQPVPARKASNSSKGWKVGDPCKFVAGHYGRSTKRLLIHGKFRCAKCQTYKDPDAYHKDSTRPHGIYIHCKDCQAERARERYQRQRDEIIARTKRYNRANPSITAAAMQRYRGTPKGAEKARKNASAYRARQAEQFVEHIEPSVVLENSNGTCGICGEPIDPNNFHVDHIIPLNRGGLHAYTNTQAAHPSCNTSKKDKLPTEVNLEKRDEAVASRTRI